MILMLKRFQNQIISLTSIHLLISFALNCSPMVRNIFLNNFTRMQKINNYIYNYNYKNYKKSVIIKNRI